jgi:hypothetical protein
MSVRVGSVVLGLGLGFLAAACSQNPPTITPPSAPTAGQSIVVTIPPPPGAPGVTEPLIVPPLTISGVETYRDPTGLYSFDMPIGWIVQPQNVSGGDTRVGTLFQSPEGNGILTVTQFDNGQKPGTLGSTANQVLEMTGVTKLPGFVEVSRTNVATRPEEAIKVELVYTRSDGVPMHALVLFQLDATTFSMVNAAVEAGSWTNTVSILHDILATYRVPAAASG